MDPTGPAPVPLAGAHPHSWLVALDLFDFPMEWANVICCLVMIAFSLSMIRPTPLILHRLTNRAFLPPNSNILLQPEDRFRFTPIKTLKPAPRLWDRKPSTPLAARGPRKLWKRVQPSLDKMMALHRSFAAGQDSLENELNTEINDTRNKDYLRGVKRLCVGLHDGVGQEGGHSFLETKWELEISKKRREVTSVRLRDLS